VARGALASFVAIALQHEGKLRSVAIEAIRVLSEDTSPSRQTRLRLCEDGAAKALGFALRDSVGRLSDALRGNGFNPLGPDVKELHEALCSLANILDPILEGRLTMPKQIRQVSNHVDPQKTLIDCCSQTKESGGLESLLWVASLPFVSSDGLLNPDGTIMHLVEESCRSLAFLSPLLLSNDAASKGYSRWADDVLIVLHCVLKNIIQAEEAGHIGDAATELHVSILQGLGALAKSAPLKVRIIDRLLPYLVEAKSASDRIEISNAASQTFQSLDFADDEIAAQVAGNNPNLLADLFCLQRSLLIQAMAREEIRRTVMEIWDGPLKSLGLKSNYANVRDFFDGFATDKASAEGRESILCQYSIIYDERDDRVDLDDRSITTEKQQGRREEKESIQLSRQMYPLNSSCTEMRWMLDHLRFLNTRHSGDDFAADQLTEHVKSLLDHCFPSQLLKDNVIPVHVLRPDASYDFRAFLMPQRRYFSFRREGQLLSRLCSNEALVGGTDDVHWTLSFTNSSFAGEFAESLVQVLYLCPMISGLSFVRKSGWFAISELDKESRSDEGGALLASLAGSLPPWISHLTFDGIMNDRDLRSLAVILETMGKLSNSNLRIEELSDGAAGAKSSRSSETQTQGKFLFFSIRHSPHLDADAWKAFFGLLGRVETQVRDLSTTPLSSLKALDLSGNQLGDDLCALVLELCHDRDSGCHLEELDLSGNRIATGTGILKVLSGYVQYHRPEQLTGRKVPRKRWKSSLHTLRLASNGLHLGKAWLEIVALLKNNALELKELDLSSNKLSLDQNDYDSEVLVSSLLKNTFLCHMNLAKNSFSSTSIDDVLGQLNGTGNASGLAFLDLSGNKPVLTEAQTAALGSFCSKSRQTVLKRYLAEQNEGAERGDSNRDSLRSLYGMVELDTDLTMKQPWPLVEATDSAMSRSSSTGENMITVLFSAPLVFKDVSNKLRPFAKLDFNMERELLWQCLKEASRDIQLFFDSATHNRLLATMAKRCSCLHYSGHGHQLYLPFEDGSGGPHWLEVQKIKDLIAAREGAPPFRFVFVSACHSGLAGETFASAGVPHVVCCQQEFELKDAAALAFTRQFYLALAVGHTIKESFDLGCKAVRATPNLRDADREMSKFVLLPRDGNHDVPIFDAKPVLEWPRVANDNSPRGRRGSRNSKTRGLNVTGTRGSEISVRNMMQEDPSPTPPQFFMAREVDMYHVLNAILSKRLVSVVGEVGIGRSSLVCALCHYINERASTMPKIERIYYVRAKQARNENIVRQLIEKLQKKMVEAGAIRPQDADADFETMIDVICSSMKNEKALVVFDHLELLEDSDEANEFPMLVSSLFRETRNVRVVLTSCHPLGIPSLGGQVEHAFRVGPLNFANTVRLFANLCPFLHTPADRRMLFEELATDSEQGELLPNDPNLEETTKKAYSLLGNGIPSRIEKAASYDTV